MVFVERRQQVVIDAPDALDRGARRFRDLGRKVRVGAFDAENFPVVAAGVTDGRVLLAAAALRKGAEIDRPLLHDHVAADVAMDLQLHFRLEGLVEFHRDRGVLAAEELAGVERGHDFRRLPGLQRVLGHLGRGAMASGPHPRDVDVFHVDVFKLEAVFDLGAAGHGAEVVAGVVEHIGGPLLSPRSRRRGEQQDQCKADSARPMCMSHGKPFVAAAPQRPSSVVTPGRLLVPERLGAACSMPNSRLRVN